MGQALAFLDEIHRPEDTRPNQFEGEDAAIIIRSLETVALLGKDSPYQLTARRMLGMALGDKSPSSKQTGELVQSEEDITPPTPIAVKAKIQRVPSVVNGEIVDGHVELRGFEQLVTALHSVREFADDKERAIIPPART